MIVYIPNIIYSSPTKLPLNEKTIFYYIIHKAFEQQIDVNVKGFEIHSKEILPIIHSLLYDGVNINSLINDTVNNLGKVKMSLIDNGFHIKLSPIEIIFFNSFDKKLYISLNPIIIDYIEQLSIGSYIQYDLLNQSIVKINKDF